MKFLTTVFVTSLLSMQALAADTYNPEGLWLTENERSAIRVEVDKDGLLIGYIAWIIDGGMQFDEKNPDKAMHSTPMCGLEIMKGLTKQKDDSNAWEDGFIYKADDGDIYDVNAEMLSDSEMKIRGYKGITLLGKTQHWKRVSTSDYPTCKPAKK